MIERSNPFPGLRPFRSDEDYLFFGREGQSDDLLRLLQQSRFLAVVGVSGSGKSSLVRAGLLPSLVGGLMAGAGSRWRIAMMRPGGDPIANLGHALLHPESLSPEEASDAAEEDRAPAPEDHDSAPAREAAIRAGFLDATLRRGGLGLVEAVGQLHLADNEKLLLVVDQFEELFRYATVTAAGRDGADAPHHRALTPESAAAFVRLLLEASSSQQAPIYVAITMRSDFLGDCAQFRDLPEAINRGQYLIPRMTREQRRRAIEGPVAVGGAVMTQRLAQRLLNDMGDSPDQLPILQHALMRTWGNWQQDDQPEAPLDLPHYEATGGMASALSKHADEVYDGLPDDRSRDLAKQLFKGLTQRGPDNRGVRRPASLIQLAALTGASASEITAVLHPFRQSDCAFIAPPEGIELTPQSAIDISHESLMRIWTRLGDWVTEEAQDAVWLQRLGEGAQLYNTGEAGLWRDPQLALALGWRSEKKPTSGWAARYVANFAAGLAFLEESREAQRAEAQREEELARAQEEARQQELERQRELAELQRQRAEESEVNARWLRRLVTALVLAVFAAALVAWIAMKQSSLVSARALVTAARSQRNHVDLRLATLLALEARAIAPRDAVVNRLLTHDLFDHVRSIYAKHVESYTGHGSWVWSVAWSPDGSRLASASGDHSVKIWEVSSGEVIATLHGHGDRVWSVAWSPDGSRLASASGDRSIKVWEVSSGEVIATLHGHGSWVWSVAWSPDGFLLASASDDRSIKVWEVSSGEAIATLQGHGDSVRSIVWSPDGFLLASASGDRSIKVWEASSGQAIATLQGHGDPVLSVAWSPNGSRLASASGDRSIKVWEVSSGQAIATLQGHGSWVRSAAWSPDGSRLASASDDRSIKVWEVSSGQAIATLQGHGDSVRSIAWSPDGSRLASASDDRSIKVWEVSSGQAIATLQGHGSWVRSAAWSPDGSLLASASGDHSVKIWEVSSGQAIATLQGHRDRVWSVAWSPDGFLLASASHDKSIKIWEVSSGQAIATLQGHRDRVLSVAWSPDGFLLASASDDRSIKVWEVSSGEAIATLRGHGSRVWYVAWSPDGSRLASASSDVV